MYNKDKVVMIAFVGGTDAERGERMFIDPEKKCRLFAL